RSQSEIEAHIRTRHTGLMNLDREQVCSWCESRRVERKIEKDLPIIGSIHRESPPANWTRWDIVAQNFGTIEINHRAVIALEVKRKIRDRAGIIDRERVPVVGGDPLV